ncbi:glucose-methanol-choline oxidoreductase-like protein, partial [Leptotrombidium deliense]
MSLSTVVLVSVDSRGTITLKSSNPFDKPKVDPKYLTSEKDKNSLTWGLKTSLDILKDMYSRPSEGYVNIADY